MIRQMTVGVMALAVAGASGCGLRIKPGDQIVAMGDSITQAGGYLRVMDAVFAQQYPQMNIPKVINTGIGGQKAEDMVKRFDKDVVARNPQIVTINVGINDVWHRLNQPHDPQVLDAYTNNLDRMVQMAQAAGAKVLILAPTVITEDPASEGNKRLKMYVEAGQQVARKHRAQYVNLHKMFLDQIWVWNHPGPGVAIDRMPLTTDGVHMTRQGDELMAKGVLRALNVPDEKIRATDLREVFKK